MVNQRGCSAEPFSLFRLLNDLRDWQRVFLTVVTSQKVLPPFPLSLRVKHPFRIRGEVVRAKNKIMYDDARRYLNSRLCPPIWYDGEAQEKRYLEFRPFDFQTRGP